jgi:hypothetical protein
MAFTTFNDQPERTQTPPFSSFFRLEPALPPPQTHVHYWTLEVWFLTSFNFLNRRPPTRSIKGTYGLLHVQCPTRTDPNSTIFVIFSVRTCTAPHTTLLDPGGLVSHEFQLFEQEAPYQIDSRYIWPLGTGGCMPKNANERALFRFFSRFFFFFALIASMV